VSRRQDADCECSFQEIVNYLERQYDDILAEQSRIKRNPRFRDNRVHALLYFISPTGHACVVRLLIDAALMFVGTAACGRWTSS
jgi:septin family protein